MASPYVNMWIQQVTLQAWRKRSVFQGALVALVLMVCTGGVRVQAQPEASKTLHGDVVDAKTGEPLPQANLRIADRYRGTITNENGRYTLQVDSLPATIVVRYVGYETTRRRITTASDSKQSFRLTPSTLEMEEVVVTGSRNPGAQIMRRVIERKQEWWPELKSYTVEAYNRFTLASDTTIAAIAESQSTAFWDAERGMREIVRSQRGTANLNQMTEDAMPAADAVLNLYDDEVTVFGNRLVGVTHPDALDYYTFTLDTTRAINGKRAFRIQVEPDSRVSSTFRGTVTVLDSAYALLDAQLRPRASLSTSRVLKKVDIEFEQQFSNFGGDYWLPVDFRARRKLDVQVSALISFSDVAIQQVSRLSDYQINVSLPDSLYDSSDEVSVARTDSVSDRTSSSLFEGDSLDDGGPFVPYSAAERSAYARIDSTDAIQDSFEPGGLVGWLQDLGVMEDDVLSLNENSEDESSGGGSDSESADSVQTGGGSFLGDVGGAPVLRFNRVEEVHFGGQFSVEMGPFGLRGRGGYNTGPSGSTRWAYGGEVRWPLSAVSGTSLRVSYHYGIEPRYRARSRILPFWGRLSNSLWVLAGEADYFDYVGNERVRLSIDQAVSSLDLDLRFQLRNERHFSVAKTSDYGFVQRGSAQPPNPPVSSGWMRSVYVEGSAGDEGLLGVTPMDRLQFSVEHSLPRLAASDFEMTRLELVADLRIETFFQRRLFPNTLDLRLDGGMSFGRPPLQRFGVIEASPLPYTPFGALRALDDRPYQGEHHLAVFWEHNFRTVPFELVGWNAPVDQDIELLLHGGHGRIWIEDDTRQRLRRQGIVLRTAKSVHHELGVSINGLLYDSIRLDLTKRMGARGGSIGVSLLRFL